MPFALLEFSLVISFPLPPWFWKSWEEFGLEEEEDIDVLCVRPVVKRYVLGTQARQVSLRASSTYSGWSGRSEDVTEIPAFSSLVFPPEAFYALMTGL